MNIFSVDNIAFTLLGYPLSYIELSGTLLYLLSVWLVVRRNVWTWPVSLASVALYLMLFYQIRLYADTVEQGYYLVASVYGWWSWTHTSRPVAQGHALADVRYSIPHILLITGLVTLLVGIIAGAFLSRAHILLPTIFTAPAAYPLLDAITTVMSFTALWLTARRRTESWYYWVIVDVIGIGLYYSQGVRFVAALYVVLLVLAVGGLISWHRASVNTDKPIDGDSPSVTQKIA